MEQDKSKILKSISNPKYLNVLGVVLFIFISFFGFLFLENISKKVNEKKYQVDSKKSQLELRLNNINKFKELKRTVEDFPKKVEILDNIKNEQQSLEQLISQLEKISLASGVIMPSITPELINQTSLQATLTLSGDYASIKKFLNGIENNQLILNIIDISISGQDPSLAVSLTLKAGN